MTTCVIPTLASDDHADVGSLMPGLCLSPQGGPTVHAVGLALAGREPLQTLRTHRQEIGPH